ncbi:MAG TPA: FixH family protein [Cytophagaceae bacterium]|jgi:hypothetical protein|nr:FixH family protein [Cytophagaceae bacterium]
MKMNWGTYIFITFGLFVIFITVLVMKTYHIKVDLVSKDYYDQELKYQEKIDKMSHFQNATGKVNWKIENNQLVVLFPDTLKNAQTTGKIEFYRPSDSSKDIFRSILLDGNKKQYFPLALFTMGIYKMKIDWISNGIDYYSEEDIYIQ